ncbi:MAG TPA: hypothetical protein V6D14_23050 [Coleofasciculaceae cyanobacterium]|jgi:hypothetical protein
MGGSDYVLYPAVSHPATFAIAVRCTLNQKGLNNARYRNIPMFSVPMLKRYYWLMECTFARDPFGTNGTIVSYLAIQVQMNIGHGAKLGG